MKSVLRKGDNSAPDVRKLASFVHIAGSGSFTKSAIALDIAHSGLSRQIQELEIKFGGRLFHRTGRGVVPTELGKMLLPRAKQILTDLRQLESDACAMSGTPTGTVPIGLPTSVAELLAGPLFELTRRRYPQLNIRLIEGLSGYVEELLRDNRIEIGLFFATRPNLSQDERILCMNGLYLVGPPGDILTSAEDVTFSRVSCLPLILPGLPHSLRAFVEEAFRSRGKRLSVPLEVDSLSTMRAVVATGGRYTVSTFDSVAHDVTARRLQAARIVSPELEHPLILALHCRRPLTVAARLMVGIIETLVRDLIQSGRWHGRIPERT